MREKDIRYGPSAEFVTKFAKSATSPIVGHLKCSRTFEYCKNNGECMIGRRKGCVVYCSTGFANFDRCNKI